MRRYFIVLVAMVAMSLASSARAAEVGIKLALLVDVSGSVSTAEFNLQKTGYVQAFQSAAVQNAIANAPSGTLGKVAVALIYWSGAAQQQIAVPWTVLSSAADSNALASAIDATTRPFSGLTGIGNALVFATDYASSGAAPTSLVTVFDVSGDGTHNTGSPVASVGRDYALANGVDTINGIVIGNVSLLNYYQDNVIGGVDAFAVQVTNFADFGAAVELKIAEEIEDVTDRLPVIPLPLAAWAGLALMGMMGAGRRRAA